MWPGDLTPIMLRTFAFAFGAMVGSFLNVAIYRWPRLLSVVTPASHCPHCGTPVPPFRNVPILAFLWMRGRAPCCGHPLSPRYFWVELMSAIAAVVIANRWLISPLASGAGAPTLWLLTAVSVFLFFSGLVVATFVDLEWMEIPDEVTLPGAALGLVAATFRPDLSVTDAALGSGAAYLVLQVLFVWGWERLTGRRGMGEGDSKLMLFIGAFIGWQGAAFALVAGSFQGLFAYGLVRAFGKDFVAREPDYFFGTVDAPSGRLVVDVAHVRVGDLVPGEILLRSGSGELRADTGGKVFAVGTPLGTVAAASGAIIGLSVRDDTSVFLEAARGAAAFFPAGGDAPIVVEEGEALFARADGSVEGPKAVSAFSMRLLTPVPQLSPERLEESAAQAQAALEKLLDAADDGNDQQPWIIALWERVVLLNWMRDRDAPTALAGAVAARFPQATPFSVPTLKAQAPRAQRAAGFAAGKLPFGPFLSLGAVEYLFFGDALLRGYAAAFVSGTP